MTFEVEKWGKHQNGRSPAQPGHGAFDRFSQAKQVRAQLEHYLMALRRRWWVLALALAFIGGPALLYAWRKAPTYESAAVMWLSGKVSLPGTLAYEQELSSYIGTQAQLIKSAVVQSRAFAKVAERFPALKQTQHGKPAESPFSVSVRSSLKSSVLELRASGPSPETTQAFLDAVMQEYLAFKQESRTRTSSGALSSLTDQIREVEQQIQQAQSALTTFQNSNNVSFLTEHGVSAGAHLSRLTETLSDLRTEHRLLELLSPAEYKGLAEGPQTTGSDTTVPGERAARSLAPSSIAPQTAYYQALQQLQILKTRKDEFASVLRPTHSKMVKLSQEIAGLEKLLKTLETQGEQQAFAQMSNRRKALELQIQNLETQYHAWETNAAVASRKLTEYEKLKQEVQRSQALYDRLIGLLQTVDLNKNLDSEPLSPLAPASPGQPTLAKYGIAAAGLFLAVLVGLGVFLLVDFLDDRFTSVKELSLILPAEVVGQIPRTTSSRNGTKRLLLSDAAFAESFRNLRSSLLFMSGAETQPRLILVTSAIPKEGKTTVAANLARTLAMSGSRVLLVDADVRRRSLHHLFGAPVGPGLLDVLNARIAPSRAILATSDPNLFLMPAGRSGNTSSDIFLGREIEELLHELRESYAHVVIDTAPVLATDDATTLGPLSDGVFMVVRAGYTSSRLAREALERLQLRNITILGTVYNGAGRSEDYYGQYGQEYYAMGNAATPRGSRADEASNAGPDAEI